MSIRGESIANTAVCEHNEINRNTLSARVARFGRESSKRILIGSAGMITAIGVLAGCGTDKDAGASDKHEALYASSCATEYKSDSNARAYKLAPVGTFQSQIDSGVILDTDKKTPVVRFTDTQRSEMIIGFNKMDGQYKPFAAPSKGGVNLGKIRVVVYGDTTEVSSPAASDGNLGGDVCVMFGDPESWENIRENNPHSYTDGDIDPAALKSTN